MQTQCRDANQNTENAGDYTTDEGGKQESQSRIHRNAIGDEQLTQQSSGIRADCFETAAA